MNKYSFFVLSKLLFFAFFISSLAAQNYTTQVQKIGLKDGLSSYTSNYIFQDSRGIVWISTPYGLNRYDGNSIKYYTKEKDGLCNNNISAIAEDDQHNLWIVSSDYDRKLEYCVFDPLIEKFYSVEDYIGGKLPFNPEQSVLQTILGNSLLINDHKNGSIVFFEVKNKKISKLFDFYIGNENPGFFSYSVKVRDDLFHMINWDISSKSFKNHKVLSLNKNGNLLNSFSCQETGDIIRSLNLDLTNLYLFCTDTLRDGTISFSLPSLSGNDLDSLDLKGDERLFFQNKKVYLIEEQAFKIYTEDGTLEHDIKLPVSIKNPQRIFISKEEDLYFFQDRHLYVMSFQKQLFKVDLDDNPDIIYKIRSILRTSKNDLYISGLGFLNKQSTDSEIWKNFKMDGANKHIRDINLTGFLEDEEFIWIGSENGILLRYDSEHDRFKKYFLSPKNLLCIIWKPYKAPDGKIWCGTSKGIYYLDPKSEELLAFKGDPAFPLFKESSIYSFHINAKGTWIATTTGLYLLDLANEKILAHYHKEAKKPYDLPSNYIAHIYEDKEGIFWLATKGDGLIKWNPKTKEHEQLTRANAGFSSDVIYAVYEDELGYLWLPSSMGLMRLHKKSRLINRYFMEDGLPENEFNTLAHYKDKDGILYFGTQNGLIQFDPAEFEQIETKATLRLLSCNIFKRDVDSLINQNKLIFATNRVEMQPNDKYIEFNFALLDCKKTKGNQYSYKVEGYDKDWSYQSSNIVKISNLPYGTYKLRFRAKVARSNQWLEYSTPIKIHIQKPFYFQIWFLVLIFGLLCLGVFLSIRSRTARLFKRQKELEAIVKERTAKIEADKMVIELQAEELMTLDKVKSKFFANISHELRTPLTLILGPLSYVLDHPEEWEKEYLQQQLLTMQRNGKSLMQLIDEILDLSKLDAKKLELEEEVTAIELFFQHLFERFQPQFSSQGQMALCSFDLRDNLYALVDRKKIEKVVYNFLSNAIKFTPKGGQIRLHISATDSTLQIEVSDSGRGIHPNDLPHIFERFYQSRQVDQKLYGGTGIGLALVDEYAKLMHGNARVDSQLGKGSRFHFQFPLKAVEVEEQHPFFTETVDKEEVDLIKTLGSDFTILVVEDNTDMRNFIQQILQKEYKRVLTAQNGQEGLDILRQPNHNIQLIVSDIMMPEVDGLEMLKIIKSDPLLQKTPVIMLTALAAERDKLNALIIGVDDYLSKPFSVPELIVRSKNLLYNYQQRQIWQNQESSETLVSLAPSSEEAPKEPLISEEDRHWIKEVEEVLSSKLSKQIPSVEELAALLFLSSRQLRRKIKRITGFSPIQFIREVQLQAARKELEDKVVISITELAYNNGFEQLSTFSKLFKKRFGKSPSEYLEK